MKERIDKLIKALNISGREFSRSIGKSESFSRTITGSIGSDVLVEIIRTYPEVNLSWLITGKGEMFNKNTNAEIETTEKTSPEFLLEYLKEKDKTIGDLREEIGRLKQELLSYEQREGSSTLDVNIRNAAEKEIEYKKSK